MELPAQISCYETSFGPTDANGWMEVSVRSLN